VCGWAAENFMQIIYGRDKFEFQFPSSTCGFQLNKEIIEKN
jgi:hypothetical protein